MILCIFYHINTSAIDLVKYRKLQSACVRWDYFWCVLMLKCIHRLPFHYHSNGVNLMFMVDWLHVQQKTLIYKSHGNSRRYMAWCVWGNFSKGFKLYISKFIHMHINCAHHASCLVSRYGYMHLYICNVCYYHMRSSKIEEMWFTYWGLKRIAFILHTRSSNEFYCMKIIIFYYKWYICLFLGFQLHQQISIGSGNDLNPNEWQFINWTNVDHVLSCHMVSCS